MYQSGTTYRPAKTLRRLLFLILLPLFLLQQSWAQAKPAEAIGNAIKSGNANAVSRYFGPSIDITVNNSSSTYSRTQGEQVLRDFFSQVRDFDVDYSGASTSSNSSFTIGTLNTANGKYKVYMFLRPVDGGSGFVLKELRIEK